MIFKKLRFKNIRSYKELEIEFPKGNTLLSGDIGVGKTSILLALQFALFGLQPGQKGASILRHGEESAEAILEIDVDGKRVVLERSLKKAKAGGITQDYNKLTVDDKEEELSTSEMKNSVIKLLEYPKEFAKKSNLLYKYTVYTPQEGMKEIIQENPETRLDTLRHIFGIDRYRRIKENCQIFTQKIKDSVKIKEVEIKELNLFKERLAEKSEKKIQLSKDVNNLSVMSETHKNTASIEDKKLKELEEKLEERKRLVSDLEKKNIELQAKNSIKLRVEKEILTMQNQMKEEIDYSPERLKNVSELVEKHKSILEELGKKLTDVNSKISVLNSKKESSLDLKARILSLENCPTCFQSVVDEHKTKISKRTQFDLEDIERELEPKMFEKDQIIKDIEKEKKLITDYDSDKDKLETDKIKKEHQDTIKTKIQSESFVLERTVNEVKEIENAINGTTDKIATYANFQKEFEAQKIKSEDANKKFRTVEIMFAERKKEEELIKQQLEEMKEDITRKEKVREDLNYLRGLQDWLEDKFLSLIGTTEANVMAKLRSEFSSIFNQWFSMLVSDSLSVRLDENFTPVVSNQDYEIDYDFLSGGERTAVALAYRLALNQVLNSMLSNIKTKDIIILDEPTDGFSDLQLDKMRSIFEQLNSEQVIIVSHEHKIEGFVDNVLKIEKDKTSFIESG